MHNDFEEAKKVFESRLVGLIEKGKTREFAEFLVIGPAEATVLLSYYKKNARPIDKHLVQSYYRDMVSGAWVVTHQGAGVDVNGAVYDCAHRFHAILASNQPQKILIAFGMPLDASAETDGGKNRSVAVRMGVATLTQSALRTYYKLLKDGDVYGLKLTRSENEQLRDDANEAITACGPFMKKGRGQFWGAMFFAYDADPAKVSEFVQLYCKGATVGSPPWHLDQKLKSKGLDGDAIINRTLYALKAHIEGATFDRWPTTVGVSIREWFAKRRGDQHNLTLAVE